MNGPTHAEYAAYMARTSTPVPARPLTAAATPRKPVKLVSFTRDEFREFGRKVWRECDREKREALLGARDDLADMLSQEAWEHKWAAMMLAMDLHNGEDLEFDALERLCAIPADRFL